MNWMSKGGRVVVLALFGFVLVSAAATAAEKPGDSDKPETTETKKFPMWEIEEQLIAATNQERARHGLPPIEMDESLVKSARQHAWWMVRNNNLQHTSAQVAENIAMGQRTAAEVVRDWMNSPGHRANMLGNYRRIGAAAYQTKGGTCYWCLQFLR